MQTFQDYAYYYNAFYKDKDYKSEAETVDKLLKRYGSRINRVINFGCGTGKHDMELVKLGYQCKGIDMSPLMIEIARQNSDSEGSRIAFEVADVRNYETDQKYDAVISLFHVMSYQNTNEDIVQAFRSARASLNDNANGCFVFDVWYGPGVLSDRPCVRVKEIEDKENQLIRIARPVMHDKENVVDVNYEVLIMNKKTGQVQTINEVHKMRYYFRPELELLLRDAGFQLLDNIDCRTLGETDYDSWTSYFIAKPV